MMIRRGCTYFAVILLISPLYTVFNPVNASSKAFSAEAIQTAPGIQETRMNLYVSVDESVRLEMLTPQGKIVQQYIAGSGIMRVLYPEKKEYIEQKSSAPLVMPGKVSQNPCANMPGTKCEKMGEELINGRNSIHWSIIRKGRDNQDFKIEQWLDEDRGITLREQLPNGVTIDATMVGNESVSGRDAERWEVIMTSKDGKSQSGTRWYDLELGITIRESFPNGSTRELRNIKVEEPDANLFMVPEGYRKLDVPAQPQRRMQ